MIFEGKTWTDYDVSASAYKKEDAVSPIPLGAVAKKSMQRNIRGLFDLWPLEASEMARLTSEEKDLFDEHTAVLPDGTLWVAKVIRENQRVNRVEKCDSGLNVIQTFEVDYPSKSVARAFLQQRGIDSTGL